MKRLALIAVLCCALLPTAPLAETIEERVARWADCARMQNQVRQWDSGDTARLERQYGDNAGQIVRATRFILHMRVADPTAPDGFRYHCPEEYHVD